MEEEIFYGTVSSLPRDCRIRGEEKREGQGWRRRLEEGGEEETGMSEHCEKNACWVFCGPLPSLSHSTDVQEQERMGK
jgi:hypothetical protein